jgi:hypothetical protein
MLKMVKWGILGQNHLIFAEAQTVYQSWVTLAVSFQNYPAFLWMAPYHLHPELDHFLAPSRMMDSGLQANLEIYR